MCVQVGVSGHQLVDRLEEQAGVLELDVDDAEVVFFLEVASRRPGHLAIVLQQRVPGALPEHAVSRFVHPVDGGAGKPDGSHGVHRLD